MKKLSIAMAAVMCIMFGINAFAAGPQPQQQKRVQNEQAANTSLARLKYTNPSAKKDCGCKHTTQSFRNNNHSKQRHAHR